MTWHVDTSVLQHYLRGDLDLVATLSVESHVGGCADCRAKMPTDSTWLGASWSGVVDEVLVPVRGPVEQMLIDSGVRAPVARILAATPTLRRSWWAAVILVLTFAVVAAHAASDQRGLLVFLTMAPLLPVMGVAAAYGPRADPLHELTVAVPMDGLRLVLVRTVAVLCTAVVMGLAVLPLLPGVGWVAAGWLLPALALTSVTLAIGSWLGPLAASGVVISVWIAVVGVLAVPAGDPLVLFRADAQVWFLALLGVAGVLLLARKQTWEAGVW
jgi:hypothetical protein